MNVLWVATKPPWPPVDGGRLVQWLTLEALRELAVDVTLVAPFVGAGRRGRSPVDVERELGRVCTADLAAARSTPRLARAAALRPGVPLSIARHLRPDVRRRVARRLDAGRYDLVHVEQLQALPQAEPAFARGVPVVLRAQNVESDLWRQVARRSRGPVRWLADREGRRLERWERDAVRRVASAVGLTRDDAGRLGRLAGEPHRVATIPAPFPAELPAGPAQERGRPAVVLIGGGWLPNRDAERWFVRDVWPAVVRRLPEARLHLYSDGGGRWAGPTIAAHPPPVESVEAFGAGSVLAVPLRIASGVRMKILEAWARGIPVVATPEAAAGLETGSAAALALAGDAAGFAAALARLVEDPGARARQLTAGREALRRGHDPGAIGRRWADLYARVAGAEPGRTRAPVTAGSR